MNRPTLFRFVGQAAIWGSSFSLIRLALVALSPSQIVDARLILGAAVLAGVAGVRRIPLRISWRAWGHVAISAAFSNVVPYLLLAWGELHTGAGLAGVLVGATPLLTLVLATATFREIKVNTRAAAGFGLGFLGVVLVLAPWRVATGSVVGAIACFLAAVSYAIGYVYVRRFITPLGVGAHTLATTQLVAASIVMLALTPAFPWTPIGQLDLGVVSSVALLGGLSTGLATILYFRLIQDVGPTTAAAVDYLVPVFAVAFAAVLLNEGVTWNVIAGGAVVLLGMGVAEGRLGLRRSTKSPAKSASCDAVETP